MTDTFHINHLVADDDELVNVQVRGVRKDSDSKEFPYCLARVLNHRCGLSPDVVFKWGGGGYIDYGYYPGIPTDDISINDFVAIDTFNVWDYIFDNLVIERTIEGFADWIADLDADDVQYIHNVIAHVF